MANLENTFARRGRISRRLGSPDGTLIDITPKSLPLNRILFLPDERAVYEGKQVNNTRVNTTSNQIVDDFIAVCDAIFRIENKGERAFQYELSLSGDEAQAYHQLTKGRELLEIMALQDMNRKSPCLCGSGRKHKACHGKQINELAKNF